MSATTQEMKKRLPIKNFRSTLRGYDQEDVSNAYRPGVKLCLERARLYTESYRQTEGEPLVIRRAKALAHVLRNMTIYIGDGEQIVGNYACSPSHLTYHPEYYWRWVTKAVNDGYRNLLDDEGRKELDELAKYWKGKSVQGMERDYLTEEVKPYWAYNGATFWGHFAESGVPDYEKLFSLGLNGLIDEAQSKLAEIQCDCCYSTKEYIGHKDFLEAVVISLQAAVDWGRRYAEKARAMSHSETDSKRKNELETIASNCEWVPGNPPRTLHEATQFFYFIHLITRLIEAYENGVGARLDRLFYPFYRSDVEEGRIDRDGAKELVEFLWMKLEEMGVLFAPMLGGGASQGSSLQQTLTIGGITPEGDDAVNDFTYVIMDASDSIQLSQPTTAIRISSKTSPEFLCRVVDSLRVRWGTVSLFNDDVVIPKLLSLGIPLADARDYGIEQCMRWTIPGKNIVYRAGDGFLILPKFLELALNRGIDKFTGKQIGPITTDPLEFTSIEDVMEAFLSQLRFFAEKVARIANTADALYEQHLPRPFLTAVLDEGIEQACDCRKWYYYPKRVMGFLGPINVANSLAAMQRLVFDEKRVSMAELLEALSINWEGREDLRQMFINQAPKFGNDDDYVDLIARRVQTRITEEVESVENCFGHHFVVDGSSASAYYAFSGLSGATPDGRKDRDMFADGSVSPSLGTDKKGPTAVLKSISKIDPIASYNHLLNQRFLPQFLENDKRDVFASYIKTWHDLGIHHIQFNVIDKEVLRSAQQTPEEHAGLTVRVAGYSAYFVDLSGQLQEEVIQRTEQAL
ncbi:MAG: pyruvate formate lyase family protein [Chloroflexota bacterium]|nr:pyruvate formate lyase family protein [Chloroflexota bacterium]